MAAPTTVLTTIKRFGYRGNAMEEWSNTYALTGTTPANAAAWRTLFDALVAQERPLLSAVVSVVGGYGYNKVPEPGDSAIWSVDLTIPPNAVLAGTFGGTNVRQGGDTAAWVRWSLDRLNSKGKRIYLRKYFHPALADAGSNPDLIAPTWVTAATAFGAKMRDGTFAEARTVTDRLGTAVIGHAVSPYVTTRTLKRRGKRPPT